MIPLPRLLHPLLVQLQLIRVLPRRGVYPLQHLPLLVPPPVRTRHALELYRLLRQFPGALDVRSRAQVPPLVPYRVYRDGFGLDRVEYLEFERFVHRLDAPAGLVARYLLPRDGIILRYDPVHRLLDLLEVVLVELATWDHLPRFCIRRFGEVEIVIEAVVYPRPYRHLRLRVRPLNGHGHDVGGGVAYFEKIRVALVRGEFLLLLDSLNPHSLPGLSSAVVGLQSRRGGRLVCDRGGEQAGGGGVRRRFISGNGGRIVLSEGDGDPRGGAVQAPTAADARRGGEAKPGGEDASVSCRRRRGSGEEERGCRRRRRQSAPRRGRQEGGHDDAAAELHDGLYVFILGRRFGGGPLFGCASLCYKYPDCCYALYAYQCRGYCGCTRRKRKAGGSLGERQQTRERLWRMMGRGSDWNGADARLRERHTQKPFSKQLDKVENEYLFGMRLLALILIVIVRWACHSESVMATHNTRNPTSNSNANVRSTGHGIHRESTPCGMFLPLQRPTDEMRREAAWAEKTTSPQEYP